MTLGQRRQSALAAQRIGSITHRRQGGNAQAWAGASSKAGLRTLATRHVWGRAESLVDGRRELDARWAQGGGLTWVEVGLVVRLEHVLVVPVGLDGVVKVEAVVAEVAVAPA